MHRFGSASAVAWLAFSMAGCFDDGDPSAELPSEQEPGPGDDDGPLDAAAEPLDSSAFWGNRVDAQASTDGGAPSNVGTKPAPRATCGAGDHPDPSLSGLNGDVSCNLSVIGQVEAPHFASTAWYRDCYYVNGPDGTTVVQVAADGTPTVTTTLTTVGFRSNWESMKASSESGLLVGYESNASTLTVFDISQDCAHPLFQSSTQLGLLGSIGHSGNFSPDGTIYYASSLYTATVYAMDLAVPKKPVLITDQFDRNAHDLFISHDGKRGYFAYPNVLDLFIGSFAIMDLSEVQARKPGARGKVISELRWEDGNTSQYPIAVTYGSKEYLYLTEELGSGSCDDPKKPQRGYVHVFDVSDEKAPKLVSMIKTEAQDPSNCKAAVAASGGGGPFDFGVGTHYCNVDRLADPRVLACGNWNGGLRVYDIRDPLLARELAYFDTKDGSMPGRALILPDKLQIWIAMQPGTFYTLKIAEESELAQILKQ